MSHLPASVETMPIDVRTADWFVPMVESELDGAAKRAAVWSHLRETCGDVQATGLQRLAWRHDGAEYEAELGKSLAFAGVDEGQVWTIARASESLLLVITSWRGAVKGGPILVGQHTTVR